MLTRRGAVTGMVGRKSQGEVEPIAPLVRGLCDECSQSIPDAKEKPRKRFCDAKCRQSWHRKAQVRGGQIYRDLQLWRIYRGAKGTPGQGAMGNVQNKIDAWNREDRAEGKILREKT